MRKQSLRFIPFIVLLALIFTQKISAQTDAINNAVVSYKKQELNSGFVSSFGNEREELLTDETRLYREQSIFNAAYKIENTLWNLLDYKQEKLNFSFEIGPMGGYGNWIDSSKINLTTADHNLYGLRATADIHYWNRFYYDPKSYSLIDVRALGRYDVYQQHSTGTVIDSFGVSSPLDKSELNGDWRFGFEAKAAAGFGRLSPMNHLMTAHYLLEKYYPGRIFSDYEIAHFAQQIAELKHERQIRIGHDAEKEMDQLAEFVRGQMLLESPESMAAEWQYGEFDPRYEGTRFEIGPFFKYYNKEPDFVYGAYVQVDYAKYQNVKWNRNFGFNLKYSRYKKQDWATAELNLGWSYYAGLRNQIDFGVKYVPGIKINNFDNVGPLSHNLIPYFSYYSQLNARSRVRFNLAWRIADSEQFILPGPEFSLAFYRSRY